MQKICILSSLTFLLMSFGVFGQSGSLDSTFGENGIVITPIGINTPDLLYAMTIQKDQKIVAGGVSGGDFVAVRYLPDGTPDPDFGNNGIVKVDLGSSSDLIHDIIVQPDGRILMAGETHINNLGDFALARLNTDGSLDTTFGVGGKVITDLGSSYEYANALAVQTDGKIIAAGKIVNGDIASANFAMVRYEANGEVDTDFGINGIAITSVRDEDEAQGVIILPNGKIVLGGFAAVNATGDYAMVGYLDDGTEDKSFGIGGKVVTDLKGTGNSDYETCMLLDQDGKIVLAGTANYNSFSGNTGPGVVRYDSQGKLDPDFGIGGIDIVYLGDVSEIEAMAQQPDGKYLLAGRRSNQWLLARIKNDGKRDSIFGNNGFVLTNMSGNTNEEAIAIAVQNDSRIVLGGFPGDFTTADFTLARYIADFIISYDVTGVSCYGVDDASITIHAQGGIAPLKYSINSIPFQGSNTFQGLPPGDFFITVCDASGVIAQVGPIHIDSIAAPPAVHVDVVETTITIIVDGAGPYSYSIDGGTSFQLGNSFPGLPDGTYQVVVMDQNGCTIYNGTAIVQATGIEAIQDFSISLSPNPCKDFISIEVDKKMASLAVIIVDMSGRLISTEEVYPDGSGKIRLNVNRLTNGQYTLWLKDGEKWATASFVVNR